MGTMQNFQEPNRELRIYTQDLLLVRRRDVWIVQVISKSGTTSYLPGLQGALGLRVIKSKPGTSRLAKC